MSVHVASGVPRPVARRLRRAEVLYRQRLQVERDLLRIGTIEPPHERSAVSRIVEKVADLIS